MNCAVGSQPADVGGKNACQKTQPVHQHNKRQALRKRIGGAREGTEQGWTNGRGREPPAWRTPGRYKTESKCSTVVPPSYP